MAGLKSRWLLILALGLAVVALILVAVFRPGIEAEPPSQRVTALAPDRVQRVRLVGTGREEIRFEKTDAGWRLTAPISARANRFRIENLLRLASAESETGFSAKAKALTEYGLDPPALTVWLDGTEIRFGIAHPINRRRYVLQGARIYLIPDSHYRDANATLTDLLDTRLLEGERQPAGFTFPDFSLTLKDGTWKLKPPNEALSVDRINGFVDEWRYARALQVKRYSGKPVRSRIRITFPSGDTPGKQPTDTLELGVLGRKPELILYRKDEGLEYYFPEETGNRLMRIAPE